MPTLEITHETVTVRLSALEKVGAVHGNLSVPRSSVVSAAVVANAAKATRGMRAPGYALPGHAKLGTWRHQDGKDFIAIYADRPAVEITLSGQRYDRILVAVDDPEDVVRQLL